MENDANYQVSPRGGDYARDPPVSYLTLHIDLDIQAVNENVEFWFYFMGPRKEITILYPNTYLPRSAYMNLYKRKTKYTQRNIYLPQNDYIDQYKHRTIIRNPIDGIRY